MRFANIFRVALVGALTFGAAPTFSDPEVSSRAAQLSAALEGSLNSDVGEAGALDHRFEYTSVMRRPGRSAEYRRHVVREMQMAAQSGAGTQLLRVFNRANNSVSDPANLTTLQQGAAGVAP